MSNATFWTEERTGALVVLWLEGLSAAEIGDAIGATKNSIIGKARRMGLPNRAPTKEQHSWRRAYRMPWPALGARP